jgi:hypothetical protein
VTINNRRMEKTANEKGALYKIGPLIRMVKPKSIKAGVCSNARCG